MNDDKVMGGVFVALILFLWFIWMLSKAVASVFHDLGIMFNEIGTAAVSFLGMAWALAQLAAILAAGAAVVYAAYRHYQLTKDAMDVLVNVDTKLNEWGANFDASNKEMEKRLNAEVWSLRRQLAAALAKPEAMPEPAKADPPKALPASAHKAEVIEVTQVNESATQPRVSNPY